MSYVVPRFDRSPPRRERGLHEMKRQVRNEPHAIMANSILLSSRERGVMQHPDRLLHDAETARVLPGLRQVSSVDSHPRCPRPPEPIHPKILPITRTSHRARGIPLSSTPYVPIRIVAVALRLTPPMIP